MSPSTTCTRSNISMQLLSTLIVQHLNIEYNMQMFIIEFLQLWTSITGQWECFLIKNQKLNSKVHNITKVNNTCIYHFSGKSQYRNHRNNKNREADGNLARSWCVVCLD